MKKEVAIIGAGPIGIEVAAVLSKAGVGTVHFERGALAETISRWPRQTQFFSSPEWISIAGIPIQTRGQEIITGETYLAYLRQVVEILDLDIKTHHAVTSIKGEQGNFCLKVQSHRGKEEWNVENIILATGDMEFPRLIGIPGEDLPMVDHYFKDPHRYFRKDLLIVGGKNSAVEAAIRSWRSGARVTLMHRKETIHPRVISRLALELKLLVKNGQIDFLPETQLLEIEPGKVTYQSRQTEKQQARDFDFVLLATGFIPDQSLLVELGVELQGPDQVPVADPKTQMTNVPGVFIAGTATGGNQSSYKVFITTCHPHGPRILRALRPDFPEDHPAFQTGNLPSRDYPLSPEDLE